MKIKTVMICKYHIITKIDCRYYIKTNTEMIRDTEISLCGPLQISLFLSYFTVFTYHKWNINNTGAK